MGPGASHPGIGQVFSDSRQRSPLTPPSPAPLKQTSRNLERDLAEGNAQSFKLSVSNPGGAGGPGGGYPGKRGQGHDQGHYGQAQTRGGAPPPAGWPGSTAGGGTQGAWSNRGGWSRDGDIAGGRGGGGSGSVGGPVDGVGGPVHGRGGPVYGGGADGTSRQQYPGAFSKSGGGGEGEGEAPPPTEAVEGGGGGVGAGFGPDRQRPVGGADLLPREIYQKLSEHVIGQVGTRTLWVGIVGALGLL